MDMLNLAFLLAMQLHSKQIRKASMVPGAPYMSHLMEVAGMVLANGGDVTIGAAALLHDAIEDVGNETRAIILEQCGKEVLALVLECTEDGTGGEVKASWWDRKQSYLQHIAQSSPGALLISVADKLQSIREVKRQVRFFGDEAYAGFVKKECATVPERKAAVLWFHRELVNAYKSRVVDLKTSPNASAMLIGIEALVDDFDEVVANLDK